MPDRRGVGPGFGGLVPFRAVWDRGQRGLRHLRHPLAVHGSLLGDSAQSSRCLPDRLGLNAEIDHRFTAFSTDDGAELVSEHCLSCHAGWLNGELVVGLGDNPSDFTEDGGSLAESLKTL